MVKNRAAEQAITQKSKTVSEGELPYGVVTLLNNKSFPTTILGYKIGL